MKWLRIISFVAMAGRLACGADGPSDRAKDSRPDNSTDSSTTAAAPSNRPAPAAPLPRVLRSLEPAESRSLLLPGPIARKPAPAAIAPILVAPGWRPKGVPALPLAPEVVMAAPTAPPVGPGVWSTVMPAQPRLPMPMPVAVLPSSAERASVSDTPSDTRNDSLNSLNGTLPGRATLNQSPEPHKSGLPPGFAQESAVFCQREIGHWTLAEAHAVLGEPQRQRQATDDDGTENGRIYAFRDPTSRYRELELDFDKENGVLRSVFVYPWNLTWQDCRKLWGTKVSATEGIKGRVFYSYVNRHLDVLVDHDGKVISLGLY